MLSQNTLAGKIYYIFPRIPKDGTVYESGIHDEVLQKRGQYNEYVQLQDSENGK